MDERRTNPPRTTPPSDRAEGQQPLPFDVQQPLPFDDESDHPVPFSLTARARRAVAPEALPDLEIVGAPPARAPAEPGGAEEGALDAPGDTRPSRARALRRAGMAPDAIARHLGADELAVRAWLGALVGRTSSHHPVARPRSADVASEAHQQARTRAQAEAWQRLGGDATFAAGLGLIAGLADVDGHSVAVTTRDPRVAGTVVSWLLAHTGVPPSRLRVVLRLGPGVAADIARHRWSTALGVPLEQISHTRVRDVTGDDEEALLRVADPAVSGAVAGWSQALLDPSSPEPLDATF